MSNGPVETLKWIIARIEEEADKSLEGKRPNYKRAATEAVEEAYGCLGRLKVDDDVKMSQSDPT